MPLNRFPWADTTIVELDPPYRLVEQGRARQVQPDQGQHRVPAARGRRRHHPGRADERDRARAGHRPAAGEARCARLAAAAEPARPAAPAGHPRGRRPAGQQSHGRPLTVCRIRMPHLVSRKLPLALLAVAAVLVLAACGNKPKISTVGDTEGTYLNVGPLTYQVQISRQLNPNDIEDQTYLQGIRPFQAKLGQGPDLVRGLPPGGQRDEARRTPPPTTSSSPTPRTTPTPRCRRPRRTTSAIKAAWCRPTGSSAPANSVASEGVDPGLAGPVQAAGGRARQPPAGARRHRPAPEQGHRRASTSRRAAATRPAGCS